MPGCQQPQLSDSEHLPERPFEEALRQDALQRYDDALADHADAVAEPRVRIAEDALDETRDRFGSRCVRLVLCLLRVRTDEGLAIRFVRLCRAHRAASGGQLGIEVAGLDQHDLDAEAARLQAEALTDSLES